jgi:hypothetical protein
MIGCFFIVQPAPRAKVAFHRSSLRIVREVPDIPLHPSPMVLRTSDSVQGRASHLTAKLTIADLAFDPDWSTGLGPAQMTLSCSSAAISAADKPSQSP